MTDIIKKLEAHEQAVEAKARDDYWALIDAIADDEAIGADKSAPILRKAGKIAEDLAADLDLAKRERELTEQVAGFASAREEHRTACEEAASMRVRHEAARERMRVEANEAEAQIRRLRTQVEGLGAASGKLEELRAKIGEARTGQVARRTDEPCHSEPRTYHQLRPIVVGEQSGGSWHPPSQYDYDMVEGDGGYFYRHRRNGKVIYPPTHPKHAG